MSDGMSEGTVEKIVRLREELARAKADNQEIMKINNRLRDTMLTMGRMIAANVK